MFTRRWIWMVLAATVGCTENPQSPDPPAPLPLPDPTPAALLRTLTTIFNDTERSAAEKCPMYESLFTADATFICPQPVPGPIDCAFPFRPEQACAVFEGLESGDTYAVNVQLTYDAAYPLDPPDPDRKGWQEIFLTNVYTRVLVNVEDGMEVNGGQGRILFAPQPKGGWLIAEWQVYLRPVVTGQEAGRILMGSRSTMGRAGRPLAQDANRASWQEEPDHDRQERFHHR